MFKILLSALLAISAISASPIERGIKGKLQCTPTSTTGFLKVKLVGGGYGAPPSDVFTTEGYPDKPETFDANGRPYLVIPDASEGHLTVAFETCKGVDGFKTGDTYGQVRIQNVNQCLTAEDFSQSVTPFIFKQCALNPAHSALMERQWFKVAKQGNDTIAELVGKSSDTPKPYITYNAQSFPSASEQLSGPEINQLVIEA